MAVTLAIPSRIRLVILMPGANFDKARNVTCMYYLTEDKTYGALLEFLDGLQIPAACSPIHDADKYTAEDVNKWVRHHMDENGNIPKEVLEKGIPEVGQAKKKHVHVMLCANGPMTPEYWTRLVEDFFTPGYWQKVNSVPTLLRYFAHLDSPQKTQYSPLGIHGFGGLDMSPLLKMSKVNNIETILDILDYVIANDVKHYNRLVRWAIGTGDIDTIACVTGRASFFANYFKSAADERAEKAKKEKELRESGYYET